MDPSLPLADFSPPTLPMPIRVHDPRADYPPATDSYQILVGEATYTVLYWSAGDWARVPESRRPNARPTAGGGRYAIVGIE
jgi:hypothetical protein